MSEYPKPNCSHCHCKKGLFYDCEPLHTHGIQCENCSKDIPPGTKPSRCDHCYRAAYCSQKCLEEAAHNGHREVCARTPWCRFRESAAKLSGNPNAWADLVDWADFHHDSFMNTTLACYLDARPEEEFPAVAADNLVIMSVWYRNDPALPVGQKFELRGLQYYAKTDVAAVPERFEVGYEEAVVAHKRALGTDYQGTGTYLLEVRFKPEDRIPHMNGMHCTPFVRHFAIDAKRAWARTACRDPFQQLKENVDEGKKMQFCCGPLKGWSTCCCGGWTHELPEDPKDVVDHAHCEAGLFHNGVTQLHTHAHCKNCFRMRRCEGGNFRLLRCSGCSITTYCSKECQKAHWRDGHKVACQFYTVSRDRAIELSGNKQAWVHLSNWVEYHHASLINAALACYLLKKPRVRDVTAKYLMHISLMYRNDPTLPPQKQFQVDAVSFAPYDTPGAEFTYLPVLAARPAAVDMGRMEMGDLYWGTGGYVLAIRFNPDKRDAVPFWKHFGIDRDSAKARPACGSPLNQLRTNLHEGKRMKFCCGKLEGLPTCCCGGWTHEISGHKPKRGWN